VTASVTRLLVTGPEPGSLDRPACGVVRSSRLERFLKTSLQRLDIDDEADSAAASTAIHDVGSVRTSQSLALR
jgi:hypothetical protein